LDVNLGRIWCLLGQHSYYAERYYPEEPSNLGDAPGDPEAPVAVLLRCYRCGHKETTRSVGRRRWGEAVRR
jgi:hypothetical protein